MEVEEGEGEVEGEVGVEEREEAAAVAAAEVEEEEEEEEARQYRSFSPTQRAGRGGRKHLARPSRSWVRERERERDEADKTMQQT